MGVSNATRSLLNGIVRRIGQSEPRDLFPLGEGFIGPCISRIYCAFCADVEAFCCGCMQALRVQVAI